MFRINLNVHIANGFWNMINLHSILVLQIQAWIH